MRFYLPETCSGDQPLPISTYIFNQSKGAFDKSFLRPLHYAAASCGRKSSFTRVFRLISWLTVQITLRSSAAYCLYSLPMKHLHRNYCTVLLFLFEPPHIMKIPDEPSYFQAT